MTPSLGLLSSADDGLTAMGSVHCADSPVLSPVHFFEVVSNHDLAQLPSLSGDGGWPYEGRKDRVFRGDRVWVLFPIGCSCGFSLLLILCVFPTVISTQCTWGLPPKGTTTRLKATARAPLGVASRGGAVWPHFAVGLCVLVQILPFAVLATLNLSCVFF
jgi:hypothetical protein